MMFINIALIDFQKGRMLPMGKYWPIIVLTVLILTVCSSEAQEQYEIPSSYLTFFPSSGADESTPEQYSEYYTMAATSFPGKHIMPPERCSKGL